MRRLTLVSRSHFTARAANAFWDSLISLNSGLSDAFLSATVS